MADVSNQPVNGYAAGGAVQQSLPSQSPPAQLNGSNTQTTHQSNNPDDGSGSHLAIPKDEVGWFFVESFYKTMAENPQRMHLFYARPSQFVVGEEKEKVLPCVGRPAIATRIQELGYKNVKVLIHNVDAQASKSQIVIQVIGEMSNDEKDARKFVETFVLAEQPNGYYVLNDILRWLDMGDDTTDTRPVEESVQQEEDAKAVESHSEVAEEETQPLPSSANHEEPAPQETEQLAAVAETSQPADDEEVAANGDTTIPEKHSAAVVEDTSATTVSGESEQGDSAVEAAEEQATSEDVSNVEAPKESEQAPSTTRSPAQKAAAPPKPAVPAIQKSWARLTADNLPPAAAPAKQPALKPAATNQPTKPRTSTPTAAPTTASQPTETSQPAQSGGWQSVGNENQKRQPRNQQNAAVNSAEGNVYGFIKVVPVSVDAEELKAVLSKVGPLRYFDVSRERNCAFLEFFTPAGFEAAVAQSPHIVNGEEIYVVQRIRKNQHGQPGPYRGSTGPRTRGSFRGASSGGQARGGARDGQVTPRGGRNGGN